MQSKHGRPASACRRRPVAAVAAVTVALGSLAACGSSSEDASTTATSAPSAAATTAQTTAAASATDSVFAAFSGPVSTWPGPDAPVEVTPGKHLTVITCGSTGITCVRVANGVAAAAKSIGYTTDVVDGRQQPTTWNQAIQSAITNKTDGIVLAAVPPVLVQGALAAAKKAGIPVAATLTPNGEGPVTRVNYDRAKVAEANTAFIAKDSGGDAHVLQLADDADFPDLKQDGDLYPKLLTQYCDTCKVVKRLDFTAAVAPQRLPGDVAQALQSDPSITYVLVPFDTFNAFVIQGIRQAGKTDSVKIVGVGADPPSVDAIKQGIEVESLGTPAEWMGWSAVDGLLRSFAGDAQAPLIKAANSNYEVPLRYVTAENLPSSGGWDGGFDYAAKYGELWQK
jgi:ribose transport system substrate-binding protein